MTHHQAAGTAAPLNFEDPTSLLRAATEVLHLVGGPLSEGYHRTWPVAAQGLTLVAT